MLSDEGRAFLNNMKMSKRPGCIGSFDRTILEKLNRKQERSTSSSGVARNFKRRGGGIISTFFFKRFFLAELI